MSEIYVHIMDVYIMQNCQRPQYYIKNIQKLELEIIGYLECYYA